jgi:hypothetical protein
MAFSSAWITGVLAQSFGQSFCDVWDDNYDTTVELLIQPSGGILKWFSWVQDSANGSLYQPSTPIVANQFYHIKMHVVAGSPPTVGQFR